MASTPSGAALRQLQRLFGTGSLSGVADDQLVQRFVAARDESAFEALVDRHGPMVLSVCHGVLRNSADAQDAFQATFLILMRKAGSVRVGTSLGSWLYRVAYNTAVQINTDAARRREMERRAAERTSLTEQVELAGAGMIPALYEEVNRLPERLRLPIVLCHLEEMTHAQAAEHLGWTVGTVRGRVARARALLRGRLARRGVVLSAGAMAATLTERSAHAAVPPAWVTATVEAAKAIRAGQAAMAGSVSAALLLSKRGIRAMEWAKWKGAGLFVLATGTTLGAAGLVALAFGLPSAAGVGPGAEAPPPVRAGEAPKPGAPAAVATAVSPRPADPASLAVGGRVLDPEGRPIEGASLRVTYALPGKFQASEIHGVSGPGGRFEVRVPRAAFEPPGAGQPPMAPMILAAAKGYGPAVAQPGPPSGDQAIRLVKDDVPIEGRVRDLEGRPVEGASIKTSVVYQSPTGDLSAWLNDAQLRGSRGPWLGLVGIPIEVTATTGPDGRFRLEGIGRERVAELTISGPRVATARLYVMTRKGKNVVAEDRNSLEPKPITYHAARFEHVAAPTKPIVGVVRDQASGRPLAGVRVAGIVPRWENDRDYRAGLSTTTDAEGRYRLVGLPTATAYRVFVFPGEGQPYLNVSRGVAADPLAPAPATCDIALKQGVLVRGRLTDKATGRPVAGRVMTYSFADNPRVKDYPGFDGCDPPSASAGVDGRFEVAAVPGRGLVVAGSGNRNYFPGAGAEAIEGLVKDQGSVARGFFQTLPSPCPTSAFQAFAEINPGPDDEFVTRDLQFDPGRTLTGTVVDPEGRPLSGTTSGGLNTGVLWDETPRESPDFQVIGVEPGRPRRIYLFHPGRKLAGSVLVDGNEAGPIVVKLQPWGAVTGRIVTDDDRPQAKLEILGNYRSENPAADSGVFPKDVPIGDDGRFQIEGLVPGLQYEARVADRPKIIGSAFKGVRLAPGETKDLGDLKPSL